MSAPVYTLAQLLAPQNLDGIRSRLLATFQGAGFPAITEWQPKGGVEMGFVDMVGSSVADLLAADLPDIIAGGFLGKASDLWMDLLAETVYLLTRVPATKTTFNLELAVAATVGSPYTWDVGDVEVVGPSGHRYRNTTSGIGTPGDFATLAFEAEAVGSAYNDSPAAMQLVTTFAGVTVRPAAPPVSPVYQSGGSTGQIVVTSQGGAGTFILSIDVSGDVGTARFSIAANGDPPASYGILLASQQIRGGGLTVFAVNGSGTPGSFVAGDMFTFAAPGGPSFVQGSDAESDQALAARCRGRWPSLSLNPTEGLFRLWALLAYPSGTRIQVSPDLATDPAGVPGRVRMYVADARGPLDTTGLAKITAFITPKMGPLDSFVASPASALPIAVSGSVLVTPTTLASVQQAAEEAWSRYLSEIPLGAPVEIARLIQALMDAGAVDVSPTTDLEINGVPTNVQLAHGQVPVEVGTLAGSLEWVY